MKKVLLSTVPLIMIWILSVFRDIGLFIRWGRRDHHFYIGYGELNVDWHYVPEEWFHYAFTLAKYPEDNLPDIVTHFFAKPPYPTITLNEPTLMDGFSVPLWNIGCLIIFVCIVVRLIKRLTQGEVQP